MSWLGCVNNQIHPFFSKEDEDEEKEEVETEYVLRFGGYLGSNGNAAAAATIYKNRNAIRSEYIMVNVRVDPVEVAYHGVILGLNMLVAMKIQDIKIEGNDYQVIENMENELRGHTKPVMRLHNYAKSVTEKMKNIEYELINADTNRRIITICRNAVEKDYAYRNKN
jgi:ribonuclease HI